jgi:uncharacterized protein involved in high-affinity Fe2+ transport
MNKRMIVLIALVAAVVAVPASAEMGVHQGGGGGGGGTYPPGWFETPTPASVDEIRGQVFDPAVDASPHVWTSQNFGGFYYDGDANLQYEVLSVSVTAPNTIEDGNLAYSASRIKTSYKNPEIGDYFVIGWFAENYMAVNGAPDTFSKIVLEMGSTDKKTLATGDAWNVGNGYTLVATVIDPDGNKVWLSLEKDGAEVEYSVIELCEPGDVFKNMMTVTGVPGDYYVASDDVETNNTFVFQKDVGSKDDVPVFSCYVDAVFRGTDSNMVQIKYAILIDDDLTDIESDSEFGKLKVGAISDEAVQLVNDGDINLSRDSDIDIAGDMKFHVADNRAADDTADNYRYYLAIDKTEHGTYEVRGQVFDPALDASPHTWTPQNFAGFYYDVDNDLQSEELSAEVTAPNTIADDNLTYSASRVKTSYKNPEIGDYFVIGWFAENYMAVNGKPDVISKILLEMGSTDEKTLVAGESFDLGNGYSLIAKHIDLDGNKVWLSLEKDGAEVESSVIEPDVSGDTLNDAMTIIGVPGAYYVSSDYAQTNNTFVFQKDIGSEDDVPVFSCYVDFVFRDANISYTKIKYAILIDDDLTEIESDSEFGKLKVGDISDEAVQLENDGAISLSRDSDIEIAGDLKFHVADNRAAADTSANYWYYPYIERTIGGEDTISSTDTDGDGVPDVWDEEADTPTGYLVNSDGIGRRLGDMNGDGRLSSVDALMILQAAVGKIDL